MERALRRTFASESIRVHLFELVTGSVRRTIILTYSLAFVCTISLFYLSYLSLSLSSSLSGDYDNMNQCLDTILTQNLTGKEKQPLLLTRIESLISTSQFADCWDLCQRCLEDVVGYKPFPENVSTLQILASLVKTKYRMKKYRDKIVDLPLLEDETRIYAYKVIENMVAASYYSGTSNHCFLLFPSSI